MNRYDRALGKNLSPNEVLLPPPVIEKKKSHRHVVYRPPRVTQLWQCNACGTIHQCKDLAINCEKSHIHFLGFPAGAGTEVYHNSEEFPTTITFNIVAGKRQKRLCYVKYQRIEIQRG